VLERFFTSLGQRRIEGIVGADGRVIVPPQEYDPVTSQELTEFRQVADVGEVTTWAWIKEPLAAQPLQHPFAWALIQLDGADTGLLHAVDTGGDPSKITTGTRVKARWRAARPAGDTTEDDGVRRYREGHILDIECFELEGEAS
jgi:uncharacterized OB-fold protein